MRTFKLLAIVLPFILSCHAAPTPDPAGNTGNVLRLPIRRAPVQVARVLSGRDEPVDLENEIVTYLIDLSIGSPAQNVELILDTGSSEVWAFTSSACGSDCGGAYNPPSSKTSKAVPDIGIFRQAYADGSSATGYYVTDKVRIGKADVSDVYLGVATSSVNVGSVYGVMGISFNSSQTSSKPHPGFMDSLLSQKIISSNSYSIFLNNVSASTGSILFGGIDKSKYTGDLVRLPIIPRASADEYPGLHVTWQSVNITNAAGATVRLNGGPATPVPVLLDTGFTSTRVPLALFAQLYDYFNVTGPDANNNYYVSCKMPKGHLTFLFGGSGDRVATVKVPFSELSIPRSSGLCRFGLRPRTGSSVLSFGDTFLRSAYYHVDFDKNQIGLAQSAGVKL